MTLEELQALLLYRDALVIVLNKPAGIPVHSGLGKIPPLDQYFENLRFGLPQSPCLAHRLDKDTSGCLVLGRHPYALRLLGKLFMQGEVKKTYLAVVKGEPAQSEGIIDLPLAQQNTNRYHWRMKVDPSGKPARTHYQAIKKVDNYTVLKLTPETGRTHQLRVHCAALQCPILGDVIYGEEDQTMQQPLHLHALSISIPLYPRKLALTISAPLPSYMGAFISQELCREEELLQNASL